MGKCWKIVSCTVSDASMLHERGERRETVRERKRWKVTDKEMSKWMGGQEERLKGKNTQGKERGGGRQKEREKKKGDGGMGAECGKRKRSNEK